MSERLRVLVKAEAERVIVEMEVLDGDLDGQMIRVLLDRAEAEGLALALHRQAALLPVEDEARP